jgi:small-conductance mechanosensitive channel
MISLNAAASPTAAARTSAASACGVSDVTRNVCVAVYGLTHNSALARTLDFVLTRPLQILLVLVIAYVANRLVRRSIRHFAASLSGERVQEGLSKLRQRAPQALMSTDEIPSLRRVQRAETIGALLQSIASFTIWVIAGFTILGLFGINLGPLLAGAGIVGVAIGFGSQNLVRDFLSGIFMLLEDQYGVGDDVDAGIASGAVEGVGLRTTRLRALDGTLWHVPNGEIRRVGNHTQGWSRAVLDVPVANDTDIDTASDVIHREALAMCKEDDGTWSSRILEEPEVWGVEDLGPSGYTVRLVVKTRPREKAKVARELRARIKDAFDEAGIDIRLPDVTSPFRPE